jgi:hypothetical protein
MRSSLFLFLLCVMISQISLRVTNVIAGEHRVEKDKFTGQVSTVFSQTQAEIQKGGFWMFLNDYDHERQTIWLSIVGPLGVDCGNSGLEVRTHDGTVHRISALEANFKNCFAKVPLELIRNRFSVRLPMRVRNPLIGNMNTQTLKPERYPDQNINSIFRCTDADGLISFIAKEQLTEFRESPAGKLGKCVTLY